MTLQKRQTELREVMDDPGCDPARLRRTLRRFPAVNRAVAGWGGVYRGFLRPMLLQSPAPARILDIGCGGGDVLRYLARLARRDGLTVEGLGIDPDPRAIAVAQETPVQGIRYRQMMSGDLAQSEERFDVVVSNHLLHHLSADQFTGILRDSATLTRGIAVHSDIARSRLAYGLFALTSIPVAPGTLLRVDGLRSIRRSYTQRELAEQLPHSWSVLRPTPFRLLAVHRTEEEHWTPQ